MPYRPKTPCHHPGCPELVEAGRLYCEKHLPLHPEATRPAAKRGYNRRWQKARKSYLEAHPLCVQCAKQGKYVRFVDFGGKPPTTEEVEMGRVLKFTGRAKGRVDHEKF